MDGQNIVFIAASLDGYIADKHGGLDWLNTVPNPDNIEMGFESIIKRIDALLMGRGTFETVCSFDIDWPYTKPVFVLSNSLEKIPDEYSNFAELVQGSISDILKDLGSRGYSRFYVDGGKTIQSFLREDLIDELIITTIPILLGGGTSLFSEIPNQLDFDLKETKVLLGHIVQSHYIRKR